MYLRKTQLKNSRIFKIALSFIYCNKIENFGGFRVFDFGSYIEIKNKENSAIFSRLLNFKEFVLFKVAGNSRDFLVFNFDLYTEIENSQILEHFSRL